LVVGAPAANASGSPKRGQVVVYDLISNVWTKVQEFWGVDDTDEFGTSVAISRTGDHMIVGAPQATGVSGAGTDVTGKCYVYDLVGTTWTLRSSVDADQTYVGSQDEFGSTVNISDDGRVIVASAPLQDIPDASTANAGSVVTKLWDKGAWVDGAQLLHGTKPEAWYGLRLDTV
jgi:hypothetical protein